MSDRGKNVGPLSDASGYAGATSVQVLAQQPFRKYLLFQNLDLAAAIWINFSGTVPASKGPGSIKVLPGGALEYDEGFVPTDAVSIIADNGGSTPYTLKVGT